MRTNALKIMVLAGGPDRERDVSLQSGATVTKALADAGHEVRQSDIAPADLRALDQFMAWGGDVVFPMLHGSWGEGGALQRELQARRLRYVGCRPDAAALCMDKQLAKVELVKRSIPTPAFELVAADQPCRVAPPVVVKAPREGSSIDLVICRDTDALADARRRLHRRHSNLLVESFVKGKELTVGVISAERGGDTPTQPLPPIQIIPATEFYDYEAKYTRDDTQYIFDIDLSTAVMDRVRQVALETVAALGCRHMSRVDMIVDAAGRPWVLEVNTIPGFTSHSLLPKAAARAGIPLPTLVDRFARLAAAEGDTNHAISSNVA